MSMYFQEVQGAKGMSEGTLTVSSVQRRNDGTALALLSGRMNRLTEGGAEPGLVAEAAT